MKARSVFCLAVLAVVGAATTTIADMPTMSPMQTAAQVTSDPGRGWTWLDDVRTATSRYLSLTNAIDDGYQPFAIGGGSVPTCFDSSAGGMGVHYVKGVDGVIDALAPEAMVYEALADGHKRLVAVEYIVPEESVEDAQGDPVALPQLHGLSYHKHPTLPLYVLHAWIWQANPDGMFADHDPLVSACPSPQAQTGE